MSASEMVVIIRPSFMKFCQDGCKAAAFNHALYWIAHKAKGQAREKIQSGEVTWYATTEEFTEGLANAWGVCKVRQAVNSLIDTGIIGRGRNTHWGADRTKHFFFSKDQCKKLLELCKEHDICLLHLGLHADVLQMINLSNASGVQLQCACKQMIKSSDASIDSSDGLIDSSDGLIDSSNANDDFIEAITKDSTKVTSKDIDKGREDSEVSQESADETPQTDSPSSQEKSLEEEKETKPDQVELFRSTFIALGKEYFKYDKFTASKVQANSEVYTRIREIIGDGKVSPQSMRVAFLKLWDHKDRDGTYWWRDKSKLTLKAYANNYDDQDELQEMDPYIRATMQSAQRLKASTPGSQYIVNELDEVAEGYIAAVEDDEIAREAIKAYYSQPTIHGMTNFAASDIQRSTSREKKRQSSNIDFASPTFYEDRRNNTVGI